MFVAATLIAIAPAFSKEVQDGMASAANDPTDEQAIRDLIDRWVAAFHNKSVEEGLSVHAPEIVSFDIVPPLRYVGAEAYRQPWEAVFVGPAFSGPIKIEIRDLSIEVRQDIAFSYSVNRFQATSGDGRVVDYWFRWTACYQKIKGQWLIVHDHSSLPTDFATGKASMHDEP